MRSDIGRQEKISKLSLAEKEINCFQLDARKKNRRKVKIEEEAGKLGKTFCFKNCCKA
jgi:hypothetical protein